MKGEKGSQQGTTMRGEISFFVGGHFFTRMVMIVFTILVSMTLTTPLTFAKDLAGPSKQGTIIPCGNSNTSHLNSESMDPCKFSDLLIFVSRFIKFSLAFMTAIATLAILYAGFLYLTSGALPEQRSQAKAIFWKIGEGFFWVAIAYMLVRFIILGLVDPSLANQIFN